MLYLLFFLNESLDSLVGKLNIKLCKYGSKTESSEFILNSLWFVFKVKWWKHYNHFMCQSLRLCLGYIYMFVCPFTGKPNISKGSFVHYITVFASDVIDVEHIPKAKDGRLLKRNMKSQGYTSPNEGTLVNSNLYLSFLSIGLYTRSCDIGGSWRGKPEFFGKRENWGIFILRIDDWFLMKFDF